MSIASELNNYRNGLDDAWDAAEDMGATIPHDRNMVNLDDAIRTIPQSQGATYTAGNGINIDANNEISVDTSVVATQTDLAGKQDTLTAGSNMTISNNVISAKVDSALSASSTNPVQNSVVKAALDGFISEDDLYSEVCGSGTTITFQDAPDNAPLSDFKLKGETSQNGTPTPDAPVAVQTVTGENVVKISDGQGNEQSYPISLGSIELCKIGDYQDSIYKRGGKWYVHKEIGDYVATGDEDISIISRPTSKMIYIPNDEALQGSSNTLLSTHFIYEWANNIGACYVSGTNRVIACGVGGVTTVESARTWLASNEPKFVYMLATPTDTEITNEALVAQLEAILSQGHTYAGTNNITTVIAAGNAQGELEICYTKTLLPIATETNLGLVQIGSGLSITPNGVLSATGGGAAQNEPIVVWLDWDSVGTDLEILGTATGQFMDNYTSSATAVGSSFFAGAVSDNKQVIIRTGGGLPVPGTDWATETVRPVQVKYDGMGSATMYFWHETMFVRAQCPNSGTTWTFTKLSV